MYNKVIVKSNRIEASQNEPPKIRSIDWVEINYESRETQNVSNQIDFKTSMIWTNLCDYCDPYILVDGNITIIGNGSDDVAKPADERDNGIIFENYVSITEFISDINNTQKDNAKDTDVAMLMYNLKKYSEQNKVKDTINYLRKQ